MITTITLQISLTKPTKGVDFALQNGSGNDYKKEQVQQYTDTDLVFTFPVQVKGERGKDVSPKLSGPYVQGPAGGKFVYIGIGQYAGQQNTEWARRLKVPLTGIRWEDVDKAADQSSFLLETTVPGTGKDGGPNCATVKPFDGWRLKKLV